MNNYIFKFIIPIFAFILFVHLTLREIKEQFELIRAFFNLGSQPHTFLSNINNLDSILETLIKNVCLLQTFLTHSLSCNMFIFNQEYYIYSIFSRDISQATHALYVLDKYKVPIGLNLLVGSILQ